MQVIVKPLFGQPLEATVIERKINIFGIWYKVQWYEEVRSLDYDSVVPKRMWVHQLMVKEKR
jgi:hypothetical protein